MSILPEEKLKIRDEKTNKIVSKIKKKTENEENQCYPNQITNHNFFVTSFISPIKLNSKAKFIKLK